jgi:hypothetical protein
VICPRCGRDCDRDEVDVQVGIIYGPWGCYCGWSEHDAYDVTGGPRLDEHGCQIDQWGGLTPPRILESEIR